MMPRNYIKKFIQQSTTYSVNLSLWLSDTQGCVFQVMKEYEPPETQCWQVGLQGEVLEVLEVPEVLFQVNQTSYTERKRSLENSNLEAVCSQGKVDPRSKTQALGYRPRASYPALQGQTWFIGIYSPICKEQSYFIKPLVYSITVAFLTLNDSTHRS